MNKVLSQAAIYLLLISGLHSAFAIRGAFERLSNRTRVANAISHDFSLDASDGFHQFVGAKSPRVLVVVLHKATIERELHFWDKALALTNASYQPALAPLEIWGVCDDGAACSNSHSDTQITIVGFLTPYQMRAVYLASKLNQALLCSSRTGAAARSISLKATPEEQAAELKGKLRDPA